MVLDGAPHLIDLTAEAKVFSQVSRLIRVAVKEGGSGDPEMNPALRTALDKARSANMPKENVQRAIDRGLGKSASGAQLNEVVYEGYGPHGVGFLVTAITDNRNRTGSEVRSMFEKAGGSLGSPGSAAYLFEISPSDGVKTKIPLKRKRKKIKISKTLPMKPFSRKMISLIFPTSSIRPPRNQA